MIEAYSLYSGSSGNAYIVKHGDTVILVDAGRSCAALCRGIRSAGISPEDVAAILITHEHTDHTSALRVFHKKYHTTFIGATPVLAAICENEEMCDSARALSPGREFSIGKVSVCGFSLPHDSSANICYKFSDAEGDSLVIATDMGEVTPECEEFLSGVRCAVIEANHDPDMLRCGPYPPSLKSRIASRRGHLSNGQCATLAADLAKTGTTGFVLAHLSRENNTPSLALSAVTASLNESGFGELPVTCAGEDHMVKITVDGGGCRLCTVTI
ncbi:MAG: MBL fold metallo-hydrolase [Ruminococcaceae bacterium]|nr:MBL fold metallo-hydrolase [Oscillospiraceae bacterium]